MVEKIVDHVVMEFVDEKKEEIVDKVTKMTFFLLTV